MIKPTKRSRKEPPAKPDVGDIPTNVSTREVLLGLIDDIDLASRELIENIYAPKARRLSPKETEELLLVIISKDKDLRTTLELATEQAEIEEKIKAAQEEVRQYDECVKLLQKQLKDSETTLSTALFQARQKMDNVIKAEQTPVNSEDLIRYAHRVSASNAVCAPLNWEQGDPRRPYPTDLEMRLGFIGRSETAGEVVARPQGSARHTTPQHGGVAGVPEFPSLRTPNSPHLMNTQLNSSRNNLSHLHHVEASPSRMGNPQNQQHMAHHIGTGSGGQFTWQGGEISMSLRDGSSIPIDTGSSQARGGPDDVEVMSTDSSSSSSTDSN